MDYRSLGLLAAVLILIIAGIRRRLVFEIQAASLLVFGRPKLGIYLYSILFLPGTLLHELSHWLMAEILLVPTGKFSILPELENQDESERRLGYVMTGRAGPFRSFLIGFAPLFTGLAVLMVLAYWLDRVWGIAPLWQAALILYGLVAVGHSMIVSREDRRYWPLIVILFGLLIGIIIAIGITLPTSVVNLLTQIFLRLDQALGLTIGVNLAIILGSYALRVILERVTHTRIMRGGK